MVYNSYRAQFGGGGGGHSKYIQGPAYDHHHRSGHMSLVNDLREFPRISQYGVFWENFTVE